MFICIEIAANETVGWRRRFFPKKIRWRRVEVPRGKPFFIMTLTQHRGKLPWKAAAKAAGPLGKALLLPQGVVAGGGMKAFSAEVFPELLLFNGAVKHLTSLDFDPVGQTVTLFDSRGIFARRVDSLVRLFSCVRVVTGCQEIYEKAAEKIMAKYGASLIVTDTPGELPGGSVVISSQRVPVTFSGTLYTDSQTELLSGRVLRGGGITLPQEYDSLCPQGIDKVDFAAALYEKCGVEALAELGYDSFG